MTTESKLSKSNPSINDRFLFSDSLALDNPYVETTKDIHISVWPEFVDSKSSIIGNLFIWAYHIRIDNKSSEEIKITHRYWRITDEKGSVQEINGEGVIGEQPIIKSNDSYQYSSGVHLRHPSGIMTGHYKVQKTSGEYFNIKIPVFSLDTPSVKSVIN